MTPIILITMNGIGEELIKYASAVTEMDCSNDIYYIPYSYESSGIEFDERLNNALLMSWASCIEERQPVNIIIFTDTISRFSGIIRDINRSVKDYSIIYVPGINLPEFTDILYKRAVREYIGSDTVKECIERFRTLQSFEPVLIE